jgi:AcrR family transcriptional regulator
MVTRVRSREALLTSLEPVFLSRGYEGATLTQLAQASGLGKASLYHHFPGGKAEMADVLLRECVARLEQYAFARLNEAKAPEDRLRRFVDGFESYASGGERQCLVAVLAQGSFAEHHGQRISNQFQAWHRHLAAVFEETGLKPKRADRAAQLLLAELYGYLLTARLLDDPTHFKRGVKRLKKDLPQPP